MNDSSRQSRLDNQTYIKAKNIYQCIKAGAEFKYDSDSLRLLKVVLSIRNKTGELLEKFLRKEGAIISFEQEQSSEKDCDIPRFYVSTSKSIIKALINMRSFEIQLSPIG